MTFLKSLNADIFIVKLHNKFTYMQCCELYTQFSTHQLVSKSGYADIIGSYSILARAGPQKVVSGCFSQIPHRCRTTLSIGSFDGFLTFFSNCSQNQCFPNNFTIANELCSLSKEIIVCSFSMQMKGVFPEYLQNERLRLPETPCEV